MKLDNQTIMMVVVAIVLGMLVANMFKEVCGCKNLIEGQITFQDGCITEVIHCPNNEACPNAESTGRCNDYILINNCNVCSLDNHFLSRTGARITDSLCSSCCKEGPETNIGR